MSYLYIDPRFCAPQQHCSGCRCFTSPPFTTTTLQFDPPPYVPKHRKPGPAQ